MFLSLFGEGMGLGAVAGRIGFVRAVEAGGAKGGFLAGEAAEAVVLGFGVGGGVVEG
jgi:hypothetical protein